MLGASRLLLTRASPYYRSLFASMAEGASNVVVPDADFSRAAHEEMLRQLLERDLVAIGGRAEDLGRPNVYVTTRRFLATFGLARLEDLPPVDGLGSAAEDEPAVPPAENPPPG